LNQECPTKLLPRDRFVVDVVPTGSWAESRDTKIGSCFGPQHRKSWFAATLVTGKVPLGAGVDATQPDTVSGHRLRCLRGLNCWQAMPVTADELTRWSWQDILPPERNHRCNH
jgi:hypothetical protein